MTKDRDAQSKEARLLRLGAKRFREVGYAGTTTRELAAALGLTSPSLYHYMGSKEDLLYRICVESLDRIAEAVRKAVAPLNDPMEALRSLIRVHVRQSLADVDMHATMLIELRSLSDDAKQEVLRRRLDYELLVRRSIAAAQESGHVRSDISARELTLGLLNLLNWTIFWYHEDGELSADGIADLLTTLFLNGALAPGDGA